MAFSQLSFAAATARIDFGTRAPKRRVTLVAVALALALPTQTAAAAGSPTRPADCARPGRPWVKFERAEPDHAPQGIESIVQHVRAELMLQRIDVCFEGAGKAPIATVKLTARSTDAVEVAIEVQDALTRKRVSRVLDLRSTPADARPLAIAVGTDELLRASWVEIAIETASVPEEPPAEVVDVIEAELHSEPVVEFGTALTFEVYTGGQRLWGIDARGGFRPASRWTTTLRAGLRDGTSVEAPNGSVDARALILGAGAEFALLPPSQAFQLELCGRVDVLRISYQAKADPGAQARPEGGTAIVATAGLAATLGLGANAGLFAEASAGAPLRPVRAADTGSEVVSIAGFGLMTGAGFLASF